MKPGDLDAIRARTIAGEPPTLADAENLLGLIDHLVSGLVDTVLLRNEARKQLPESARRPIKGFRKPAGS